MPRTTFLRSRRIAAARLVASHFWRRTALRFAENRSGTDGSTAGFALIEALVAIAVVAISLVSIGSLMASTARGVRSLQQHVALVESARAVAAGLPSRAELAPGSLAGEIYGNRWRIDTVPFSGVPGPANSPWIPQAVSIRLQAPSGAILSLETVRLRRRRTD